MRYRESDVDASMTASRVSTFALAVLLGALALVVALSGCGSVDVAQAVMVETDASVERGELVDVGEPSDDGDAESRPDIDEPAPDVDQDAGDQHTDGAVESAPEVGPACAPVSPVCYSCPVGHRVTCPTPGGAWVCCDKAGSPWCDPRDCY